MKREDFHTLPHWAQKYIENIDSRAKSSHTAREYASDLRLFFRYVAERRGLVSAEDEWADIDLHALVDTDFIKSIRSGEILDFNNHCRDTLRHKPTTLSRRFIAVKRFFRYLTVQRHVLEQNPMDELDPQKTGKRLPVYLPLEDCLDLLRTVEHDVENQFRERDYCILTLFLNCGMRLSELCGLNLADIYRDDTMRIRGKGSKERTVYLNPACTAALRRYLPTRPQEGLKAEDRDAVFISRNKRRLNQRSVEMMLEKYLKFCGLEGKGYSIHTLRHTAATLMYQNDVDVLQLKEILGHENLSTTQIYTHVLNSQLQDAVRQNPLADIRAGTEEENRKATQEAVIRMYEKLGVPDARELAGYPDDKSEEEESEEEKAARRDAIIAQILPKEMRDRAKAEE